MTLDSNKGRVAVSRTRSAFYPKTPPFHPDKAYPELQSSSVSTEPNPAFEAVRECFRLAGLDSYSMGTPNWNPLRDTIRPGETVLLKPNLVKESHATDPDGWDSVLTHGSVIRAVSDYVWKALDGKGKILVADAPQTDSSFDRICKRLGLYALRDHYRGLGLSFELLDLRQEEWVNRGGVIVDKIQLAGDPEGYLMVDLGARSEFSSYNGSGLFYGADYDTDTVRKHHSLGRHEYLCSGSAIKCDILFNLPKLKTHKKAGVTLSLKNLVGINGNKNYLPHHTEGYPSTGGDEHPDGKIIHQAERKLVAIFRFLSRRLPNIGSTLHIIARRVGIHFFGDTEAVVRSGNWWGNDTLWRTCIDLNKLVLYAGDNGELKRGRPQERKRHVVLVDGIVGGEGRGPMNPDPVHSGIIVFSENAPSADAASAILMGFDPDKIPIIKEAFMQREYSLAEWSWRDIQLISNYLEWNGPLDKIPRESTFHFRPHFGWKGHIER